MSLFHTHRYHCLGVSYFRAGMTATKKGFDCTTLHLRCRCGKVKTKDVNGKWTVEQANGA